MGSANGFDIAEPAQSISFLEIIFLPEASTLHT